MITLHNAPPAPRGLLYLATFNDRERHLISETPALREQIRTAEPNEWAGILQRWRDAEAKELRQRIGSCDDSEGYRAQALQDLNVAARDYAGLSDGRRTGLFSAVCRVAKYAAHGHLSKTEIRSAFVDAALANGALQKHGPHWVESAIRSATERARGDVLPPLARQFRTQVGRS